MEQNQLSLEDEKPVDQKQSEDKENSEISEVAKKFSFNLNAPPFTPRQQQSPTTPTQVRMHFTIFTIFC